MILKGDEDAQPPLLRVYLVLRGGVNGVSLVLDRLGHGLNSSLWAGSPSAQAQPEWYPVPNEMKEVLVDQAVVARKYGVSDGYLRTHPGKPFSSANFQGVVAELQTQVVAPL